MNYYNENDPFCCQWLRNLISAGLIPKGDVDERSIQEVQETDLKGYIQCHFFTGIAGWPLALALAGWPSNREIFTGSCPCQPFSVAGKRKGIADARHLWPDFHRLIRTAKPSVVMGEQVSGTDGYAWVVRVGTDMEREGYRFRKVDIPACGIGAPHRRNRLYWVADANKSGDYGWLAPGGKQSVRDRDGKTSGMAYGVGKGLEKWAGKSEDTRQKQQTAERSGDVGRLVLPSIEQTGIPGRARESRGTDKRMANTEDTNWRGKATADDSRGRITEVGGSSFWSDYSLIPCLDGKSRRVEPGTFPLAHGVPGRMGRLRAYGNAIVPELAAQVIAAYLDAEATEGR